jgi:hypothetical protein
MDMSTDVLTKRHFGRKNDKVVLLMRKFLFLIFGLFAWQNLSAQDKIITVSGDTILCRIISTSGNHMVYEQPADKNHISGKVIPLDNVAEFFRATDIQPSNEMYISRAPKPKQPWLLSLSAGRAHMPWLLEDVTDEYVENDDYEKLDNGFVLNASVHYLITNHVGFGVHYSFFTSGFNSRKPAMISSFPLYTDADIRERQYVNYAGLSAVFRQFLDNNRKFSLSETLSGGFLFYRDENQGKIFMPYSYFNAIPSDFRYVYSNSLVTGNAFGATIGLSAEYKILPYLSVGIGGSFLYGNLSKASGEYRTSEGGNMKFSDEELEKSVHLSRIDYSLVVRFQL